MHNNNVYLSINFLALSLPDLSFLDLSMTYGSKVFSPKFGFVAGPKKIVKNIRLETFVPQFVLAVVIYLLNLLSHSYNCHSSMKDRKNS